MNTTTHKNRTETRQEKETQRRRKRDGGGEVFGRRLGVSKTKLDFDNFAYRWINDEPGRLYAMTKEDDWDFLTNDGVKDDSTDIGARVAQVVGSKPDGSPKSAFLCRKPKQYFREDQKAKQAELDKQLEDLRRGSDRTGSSQSDYIPTSGIRI